MNSKESLGDYAIREIFLTVRITFFYPFYAKTTELNHSNVATEVKILELERETFLANISQSLHRNHQNLYREMFAHIERRERKVIVSS